MGRIVTLVYDFVTATTGRANGTPRPQGAPQLFGVNGALMKSAGSLQVRLRRLICEPRFTAGQLAGAAADVVSARDAIGDVTFGVNAGQYVASGPHSGPLVADGSPMPGLGVAGADYGGNGRGCSLGLIECDGSAGLGVFQDFQGATGAVSVLWVAHLEVEMGPFADTLQFLS